MARTFVFTLKAGLDFSLSLYRKFLDACPEEIWRQTFGGRPVSQQVYHALAATGVYLQSFTGEALPNPFPEATDPFPETGDAGESAGDSAPEKQPSLAQAGELLHAVKTRTDALLGQLDDEALEGKNEAISLFLETPVNNAAVLEIMAAHLLYHLGAADAALRQAGIAGVFSGVSHLKAALGQANAQLHCANRKGPCTFQRV